MQNYKLESHLHEFYLNCSMKKIFTLHFFLVFLVVGCIGSKKKKNLKNEKETITVEKSKDATKNSVYKNMEKLGYTIGRLMDNTKTSGCTFIIQVNDSTILEPVNLESKFKEDGLKIAFKYRKSRAMTTCMMGQTVVVSEVKVLKEE